MKTNDLFFGPKRLVFMGVDQPKPQAEMADKGAKPDFTDNAERAKLLQQVDKKLAELDKSSKPADQERAEKLREVKDKAVLDMLGGVKEVEAANRLHNALMGKAPELRAEVRAERTKLPEEMIENRAAKAEEKDAIRAYRAGGEKGTKDKPVTIVLENGAVYKMWESSSGVVAGTIQRAGDRSTYRQDVINNA